MRSNPIAPGPVAGRPYMLGSGFHGPSTMDPTPCDHEAVHEAGYTLSWSTLGPEDGPPVFVHHGLPGSRRQAAVLGTLAAGQQLRLIGIDRPGFGRATPRPAHDQLDVGRDTAWIADRLGLERYAVIGVSGGGPYALACAVADPDRVRRVLLIAAVGDLGRRALCRDQALALRLLFRLARIHPRLCAPFFLIEAGLVRWLPRAIVALARGLLAPAERRRLETSPMLARLFLEDLREAYRQGVGPAARDAARLSRGLDFDPAAVRAPVELLHGRRDRQVPLALAIDLVERLPDASLVVDESAGHLDTVLRADPSLRKLWISELANGTG